MCYSLKTHVMGQVSFTVVWTFCKMWSFFSLSITTLETMKWWCMLTNTICMLEFSRFKIKIGWLSWYTTDERDFCGFGTSDCKVCGFCVTSIGLHAFYFSEDLILFHPFSTRVCFERDTTYLFVTRNIDVSRELLSILGFTDSHVMENNCSLRRWSTLALHV